MLGKVETEGITPCEKLYDTYSRLNRITAVPGKWRLQDVLNTDHARHIDNLSFQPGFKQFTELKSLSAQIAWGISCIYVSKGDQVGIIAPIAHQSEGMKY